MSYILNTPTLTALQITDTVICYIEDYKWSGIAVVYALYPYHFDFKFAVYDMDGDFDKLQKMCEEELRYNRQSPTFVTKDVFEAERILRQKYVDEFRQQASRL